MTPVEFVTSLDQHGSIKAVARQNKMSYHGARTLYLTAVDQGLISKLKLGAKPTRNGPKQAKAPVPQVLVEGQLKARQARKLSTPETGTTQRFIFTCAQNNTEVHGPLWKNLLAFAEHYNAQIHVSRFLYVKAGLGARGDKAEFVKKEDMYAVEDASWDKRLTPYFSDDRLEVAPGLVWCGEMNILPTAVRPLSGLEVYTGRRSGIFPHVKLALQSIPSATDEPTKFNYTTGAITLRNYIQKKAGLKAEFHHAYGALLVEVDDEGNWFARQLHTSSDGTFYDLDVKVSKGKVTTGHRVEAITWGDIHVAEIDLGVRKLAFAPDSGMLDVLRPRFQFLHDVLHFKGRSHHEIKNPHVMYARYIQGAGNVQDEVDKVGWFLLQSHRPWCQGVVVDSNHHHHLGRWLQEQDGRADPLNAEFYFKLQSRVYRNIRAAKSPNYLLEALQEVGYDDIQEMVTFLGEDKSFVICEDEHGGIECGMHGDQGPNGSRGAAPAFARMGRRMNRGHEHSAGIYDGVYTSGTCGLLHPDWTHGPGSWSHSHILTYPNGKRTIVTMWAGKWRTAS